MQAAPTPRLRPLRRRNIRKRNLVLALISTIQSSAVQVLRCSRTGFALAAVAGTLLIAGCSSRRPVVGHQPAPTQPTATPAATEEAAKRSTDIPDSASTTATVPSATKRPKPAAIPVPAGHVEEGNASWYGNPFHGRRASNGEVYDMNKLTAAHRTLPFETMVRVTNLNNGKSTTVRITDRGPFVENRIIDLSRAAAEEIESIGPGVVPVRVEVVSAGVDLTGGFFCVQVGAFKDKGNADRLRERLMATYSPVVIQTVETADGAFYRVRVGRVSGEDAARDFASQLGEREGFTTLVFRLDETPAGTR